MEAIKKYTFEYLNNQFTDTWSQIGDSIESSGDSNTGKKRSRDLLDMIKKVVTVQNKVIADMLADINQASEERDEAIKDKNNSVDTKQQILEDEIIHTRIEHDKQIQKSKYETIRIHNTPAPSLASGQRENVSSTVVDILKDASININESLIKNAVRPMKGGVKGSNIYVTFLRGTDKLNILRQRKTKMSENREFVNKRPNVFIAEDLTPLRQLISFKLRHDKDRIAKVWSMDGRIKCHKKGYTDSDKPITIDSPYDLKEAGWHKDEIDIFVKENLLNIKI